MNDETEKPQTVTSSLQDSDSSVGRTSAVLGISAIVLMSGSIILRLLFGFGRIGLTAYGERLFQLGIPFSLATALDFGNASGIMLLAMLLGLLAFIFGIIAVFRKGRKRRAKVGIITGGLVVAVPLLLPLL